MSESRKGKRHFVCSSSSSSSSSEEEKDDERSVSSCSDNGSDWSEEECDDDDDGGDEESDDDDDGGDEESDDDDDDGDEALCNRVMRLLQEGSDLEALTLRKCKAYLRKHGLRISGTKPVCIERIQEHWRIKDGNGEALYPRSAFAINCTGDVCKGDVVLFTQKVYEKFDKVTRKGGLLGKRTIAGRVVKETYGAAKQQHTFTVEILWSKGIKKLPPLFPLLVKGRNLYKFKTFRQRWTNEAARLVVLAEKHKRGTAARLVRAIKKTKKTSSANGGAKRQKHLHHGRLPSQTKQTIEPIKGNRVDRLGKATSQGHAKLSNHPRKGPSTGQVNLKRNTRSKVSESSWRHQKLRPNNNRVPAFQSHANPPQNPYQSQNQFHHRSTSFPLSSFNVGSPSAMMRLPPLRPQTDSSMIPVSRHLGFNHNSNYTHLAYSNTGYHFGSRNLNHFPELTNYDKLLHPFPPGTETYGQRKRGF